MKNNWQYVEVFWLTLLKTELSEKPSIVKIIDNIGDSVYNEFQTLITEIEVSDKIIQMGVDLNPGISKEMIASGKLRLQKLNSNNVAQYMRIIQVTFKILIKWNKFIIIFYFYFRASWTTRTTTLCIGAII